MGWYRVYQGLPFDARLGVVARRSGLSRAEVIALYIFLFDAACNDAARGSVAHLDAEETGVVLGLDAGKVEAAMAAMRAKGLVTDAGCIADWDLQIPPSTARVRAHRRRKLGEGAPAPQLMDDDGAAAARRARLEKQRSTGDTAR